MGRRASTIGSSLGLTFIRTERHSLSGLLNARPADLEALQRAEDVNQGVLLTHAFEQFDKDRSGNLDIHELQGALSYLGVDADSEQARAILVAYDSYPDQVIDMKEFTALVRDIWLLKKFDNDKDGLLNKDELQAALSSLGLHVDAETASRMISHFDMNGNDCIDLAELSSLIKTAVAFVRYDADSSGSIDENKLREALTKLGLCVDGLVTRALFRRYDSDGNGTLDVIEFALLARDLQLFVRFDEDFNGTLDANELGMLFKHLAFNMLGPGKTPTDSEAVLNAWDADANGSIDINEFAQMMADMRAFKEADAREAGALNRTELKGALKALGIELESERAVQYLSELAEEISLIEFAPTVKALTA